MSDVEQAPATVKAVGDIGRIDAAEWDACAGGDNPFLSHAFLKALEDSGSVRAETGWAPYHVAVEDADGKLRAAAPLYLKSHSMGEYMFDYGWANAFERAGGRYYPKLQLAVPFTPVTGPRLLARDDADRETNRELALAGCVEVARQLEVSSLHITFLTEEEWKQCGASGLLRRTGEQFHDGGKPPLLREWGKENRHGHQHLHVRARHPRARHRLHGKRHGLLASEQMHEIVAVHVLVG